MLQIFLEEIQRLGDGTAIFLSIMGILMTIGLGYLIFRSVRKERIRYKDETLAYIEGLSSYKEISSRINNYISKPTTTDFGLMMVSIDGFDEIKNSFGEKDSKTIIERIAFNIVGLLPKGVEVGRYKESTFIIFFKAC